jgi:hypothetical protein
VTDPCHPLYGRRFPVFSIGLSARSVGFVVAIYQDPMRIRIPISATNLVVCKNAADNSIGPKIR